MKALYVGTNGRVFAEDVSPNIRLIEEPDGLHPIKPDNIWRNDGRPAASWGPDESLCVIFQGESAPETWGEGLTAEFVKQMMKDDFILKLHDQKQSVSKLFWRRLMNSLTTGAMLFLAVGIVGIFCAFLYAIAVVLL